MTDTPSVVVFDTDGTLVDARRAILDAVAEGLAATYRHFGLPGNTPDHGRIARAMGLPSESFFRAAFEAATVPAQLVDSFAREFQARSTRAEIAALLRGDSRLYEGAETALESLRQDGHRLALISNAAEPYFRTVVEVHGMHRWFDRTMSLETALRRRLARDKTGMVRFMATGSTRITVVGDRVHDIEAGRSVGARTVGCRFGFAEDGELDAADWVIDSLLELPGLPLLS